MGPDLPGRAQQLVDRPEIFVPVQRSGDSDYIPGPETTLPLAHAGYTQTDTGAGDICTAAIPFFDLVPSYHIHCGRIPVT